MNNLGDFTTSETIYVPFNTFDSAGAAIIISDFALADIKIYKDGSVTQRTSTSGIVLLDTPQQKEGLFARFCEFASDVDRVRVRKTTAPIAVLAGGARGRRTLGRSGVGNQRELATDQVVVTTFSVLGSPFSVLSCSRSLECSSRRAALV